MWVTPLERLTKPFVQWGENFYDLSNQADGSWHTYNVGHFGFHGHIYVANITNLQPRKLYYYRVGDRDNKVMSDVRTFISAPSEYQELPRVHLCVYGDQGTLIPFSYPIAQ